jgi:hypothetical protein
VLLLTIASLGYAWLARTLGYGIPYSFPGLFVPRSFLADFLQFRDRFHHFGHPEFFSAIGAFMYPPAMVLPLKPFFMTTHPGRTFVVFVFITGCFFTLCLSRVLHNRGLMFSRALLFATGVGLTSYPLTFVLQRGNSEVFIGILVIFGVWSFYRGHYMLAAICFGFATALKLYPFIFFALFLPRRLYREIFAGAVTAVGATFIALRLLSPHPLYALHWDLAQLGSFGTDFESYPWWLGYDHSFFGLIKLFTLPWHLSLAAVVRPYTWFMAACCLVLYFRRIWKLPLINQVLALSVLAVSITPFSFDYTLISLYPAFAILCSMTVGAPDEQQRKLLPYFLLFALILTPQTYLIVRGSAFGAQLRSICLLIMLILAVAKPLTQEVRASGELLGFELETNAAKVG